jgi:cell wall-associated protease
VYRLRRHVLSDKICSMLNSSTKAGFIKKIVVLPAMLFCVLTYAQKPAIAGWHLLDKKTDGYNGISLQKAYDFLHGKISRPVVVAVIDGGVDTTHEDLKGELWINKGEIPKNGIDDDQNGYVDDIFGWNFLGNKKGENVENESMEAVRQGHKLKNTYLEYKPDTATLEPIEKKEYKLWLKANELLNVDLETKIGLRMLQVSYKANKYYDSLIRDNWGVREFTAEDLEEFVPRGKEAKNAKFNYLKFIEILQLDRDKTDKQLFKDIEEYLEKEQLKITAKVNPPINYREKLLNDDDADDILKTHYGNNDITTKTSMHGTHVS